MLEVNVGGRLFCTTAETLGADGGRLGELVASAGLDAAGRAFLDREPELFAVILRCLRAMVAAPDSPLCTSILPSGAQCLAGLKVETQILRLPTLAALIAQKEEERGHINVGYQGSFGAGRQGLGADVAFRKISRLIVGGRVSHCRDVFGDALNEGRDPDRGDDQRFTARFFLKHTSLEQCVDALGAAGFGLVGTCASGASQSTSPTDEDRWAHYNLLIFHRP